MNDRAPARFDGAREGRRARRGGVVLPAHKGASTSVPLAPAPLPTELVLPLEGGLSARDIHPAIRTGQRVLRGQPLVRGGGPLTTWTHASTSGVVRSLETHPVGHARRRQALCAVLDVDGEDEAWPEIRAPDPADWDTPDKLAAAFSRAGLAGLGGAVFPTGVKLAASWRRPVRAVIVNGAECEPYISCDDMLMRSSPRDVLAGALALVELTDAEQGFVALEEDKPDALEALERELSILGADQKLTLTAVPTVYPAGGERQLIQQLTGHEVPSLAHPTDIGYLCQNVGTAAALYRFLTTGHPLTSRVTTITGDSIAEPRNLEVRLGTRVADLVAACGGYTSPVDRLIMGGNMMGIALESDAVPVTRATNCIIAAASLELRQAADALPCIRCGACAEACPAYLAPQDLYAEAERDRFDALENLGLFDCIECGCCDVVCPSHIPLTESFRAGKHRLVHAMDHEARVQWFQTRDERRRRGVERWQAEHGGGREHGSDSEHGGGGKHGGGGEHGGGGKAPAPIRRRAEGVADVIDRVRRLPESET